MIQKHSPDIEYCTQQASEIVHTRQKGCGRLTGQDDVELVPAEVRISFQPSNPGIAYVAPVNEIGEPELHL